MSEIRKKSLKGIFWVYIGFFIGAINTYLFTHSNWFNTEEYGFTRAMLDIGILISAFSTLGTSFFIVKFFPYYNDNLPKKDNDLLGLSIKIASVGFLVTISSTFLLQPIIIKKFGTNAGLLVENFYTIIPVAFFFLIYTVLESYSYGFSKGVITNLLKETVLRLFVLLITTLKILGLINFKSFSILFSMQFAIICIALIFLLKKEGNLWITFKTSRVTKKYRKKIITLLALTFIVVIVNALRSSIDVLVLASKQNLSKVAIFGFISYLVSIMMAPFKSIIAITIPILSRCWKDKNIKEISRIYKRSSINLLSFSLFMFCLILLNLNFAIEYFNLNKEYLEGYNLFILLGVVTIIQMGTGVNGEIIGTSTYYRFELWTSILLTLLIIPLSYILTSTYGLIGPAIANLISFSIYNFIRYMFLLKKFNLQPFTLKSLEVIAISIFLTLICHFMFKYDSGLIYMIMRSFIFSTLFIIAIYFRNISPDLKPIISNIHKRIIR